MTFAMNDEFDFQPLEARLRSEARTLSSRYGRAGSAAALAAEHARRRRRRIGRAAAASCFTAAVIGASWWTVQQRNGSEPPPIAESPRQAPASAPKEMQPEKTPDSKTPGALVAQQQPVDPPAAP